VSRLDIDRRRTYSGTFQGDAIMKDFIAVLMTFIVGLFVATLIGLVRINYLLSAILDAVSK